MKFIIRPVSFSLEVVYSTLLYSTKSAIKLEHGYLVRLAGEIPPFLAIPFYSSGAGECHIIQTIEHQPLLMAVGFRPAIRPVGRH